MIKSKKDYRYYFECDRIALEKKYLKSRFVEDEIWRFEIMMRKAKYYKNCSNNIIGKIYFKWLQYRYYKMRLKFGFSIPLNVFESGLSIAHCNLINYREEGSFYNE